MDWNLVLHDAINGALIGSFMVLLLNATALLLNGYRARHGLPPLRRGWPFK